MPTPPRRPLNHEPPLSVPIMADAPDACDASATPFQEPLSPPAPVLRLVSARPRLAGSGIRPVIR